MLNIVLLIACVLTAVLLLLYLFYWNRVLALVISIVLRIAFWNQAESSIWLDIGVLRTKALQLVFDLLFVRCYPVLRDSWKDSVQGSALLLE